MAELDTGLPSIRQVQNLIKDKTEVEVKVITNDLLVGQVRWQDENCLCLLDHYEQPTIVWRQAIVYIKPRP
jgi:host factor-I protein